MKISTQNRETTEKQDGAKLQRLFSGKSLKKHEVIAGAAIFVFAVLHFVSPFIVSEHQATSDEVPSVKSENKEGFKGETDSVAKSTNIIKNADIIKTPEPVSNAVHTKTKAVPPRRTVGKKKALTRESRAERLRRAERILTGV